MKRPSRERPRPHPVREPKSPRDARSAFRVGGRGAATPAHPLPLAAASVRLRGKPGRPRRVQRGAEQTVSVHTATAPVPPRLLDVRATAAYLGLSPWTVRDLEAAGVLRRVIVTLCGGRELRKLLFDRADLDRLIGVWKERADV